MNNEFESETSFYAKYLIISIQRSTVTSSSLRYESSEITLIKQKYEKSSAINFFRQSALISQNARIQQRDQSEHQRDAFQSKYQRDSSQSALISQDARVQRFYQRDQSKH